MLRFLGLRRAFENVTSESLQVADQGLCPELGMGHNQTGLLSLHLWGALAALSWGQGRGKFVSGARRLFNYVFWITGIFGLEHLYQNQCKGPDWCSRAHATWLATRGDALQTQPGHAAVLEQARAPMIYLHFL